MAPNDRIIVADILPTRLREEADKVGTEQASLLREAAGRIRTLTDWTRNLRDSLRKADAEASRLRHCDEALRMLGFNDEHCKTDDPLVYAEAVLQSLRVTEQSDLAAAAERERIVKLLRDFARAARARGGPLDDDQARGEWWKEITAAEAFARKIEGWIPRRRSQVGRAHGNHHTSGRDRSWQRPRRSRNDARATRPGPRPQGARSQAAPRSAPQALSSDREWTRCW